MTFVGKILVVVIMILSICVAAFTGGAHAFQKSWKTKAAGFETELGLVRKAQQTAAEESKNSITKLQNDLELMKQKRASAESDRDNLRTQLANAQAASKGNSEVLAQAQVESRLLRQERDLRQKEIDNLQKHNKELHGRIENQQQEITNLKDAKFNLELKEKQLVKSYVEVLAVNALMGRFLRSKGHVFNAAAVARMDEPTPIVQGFVLNTKRQPRDRTQLIEISLGRDDGLDEGHDLYVYRNAGDGRYLGKIRLVFVTPDRAVGKVTSKAKNGIIQRGDNVSTTLSKL